MSSHLAWVDFTESDRQRLLDVVRQFREPGAIDELGIGTIRDAFADSFFPGTSTLQTRARYFLFIPWMYKALEASRVPSSQIARRAHAEERRLIDTLLKAGERDGVIGRESRERLQRLPSSIYWAGLRAWGIRLFPGSQDQYHRSLDTCYRRPRQQTDDGEPLAGWTGENWHPGLPEPPTDWPQRADFRLTRAEAEYLRSRILARHGSSLLARLVAAGEAVAADYLWEHPLTPHLPEELSTQVAHAHNFSDVLYGAALLYNLMLAEKRGISEVVDIYRAELADWGEGLDARRGELQRWHERLDRFWGCPALRLARIPAHTVEFVEAWLRLLFAHRRAVAVADDHAARRLLHSREVRLKGARAKLENPRALELWQGAAGAYRLDYRWGVARRLITDIALGLQREGAVHA